MSGRVQSFLAGVLLTSSLTYLTAQEIRKNQETVFASLRASNDLIINRNNKNTEYIPGSNMINRTDRSSIRETFADIWNNEIIKGVNWVYGIRWITVGEKVESGINHLSSSLSK